jgi:hypothetical protein
VARLRAISISSPAKSREFGAETVGALLCGHNFAADGRTVKTTYKSGGDRHSFIVIMGVLLDFLILKRL